MDHVRYSSNVIPLVRFINEDDTYNPPFLAACIAILWARARGRNAAVPESKSPPDSPIRCAHHDFSAPPRAWQPRMALPRSSRLANNTSPRFRSASPAVRPPSACAVIPISDVISPTRCWSPVHGVRDRQPLFPLPSRPALTTVGGVLLTPPGIALVEPVSTLPTRFANP